MFFIYHGDPNSALKEKAADARDLRFAVFSPSQSRGRLAYPPSAISKSLARGYSS
jgi:hypothetical protein